MKGKLLIVEDEPIVALDLEQEVEQLGCEVVGVAESADEALIAAAACKPDLALLDIRIVGTLDGIQTARMLKNWYEVPSIFLTSYSDETTLSRAAREMPYGYLTKPFQATDLKAALQVGLHKARTEAEERDRNRMVEETLGGMPEGLLTLDREGRVKFMNAAAETLTEWSLSQVLDRPVEQVLALSDERRPPLKPFAEISTPDPWEEFGWTLKRASGAQVMVDLCVAPIADADGLLRGFVVTVRDAAERMRCQAFEQAQEDHSCFEQLPLAMVQLDSGGRIVKVNKALLEESGVAAESLVGRSLTGLSMDPDPKIARDLMHKLLGNGTFLGSGRMKIVN